MEKRQRGFDKTISELQSKCNDMSNELAKSLTEGRGYSAELFRVKAHVEEAHDTCNALRRENKNLAGEKIF